MNVVDLLNISNGVIVPNKWNLENFKSDGVTVPIYHCPLFVDTDTFFYKPPAVSDEFVFGTANADVRKRIVDVIRCFSRTFDPSIKNVKLRVKIDREDIHKLPRFSDSRIQICTEKFTSSQLLDWYHSLNLFVSGVSAEGWGFMQHEVMAAGRPILAPKYAGLAEFFDETVGVELKYDLVPAEWSWSHSNGFWTKFDQSDMIKKMRWCVENKSVITNLGIKSEVRAKQFTTDRFVENLNKIITNLQT
jgi:glycosyltransferase involved in cell wall biosynthesis